jgi:class 3 adenylate cyclase
MESHGTPGRIQITPATKAMLDDAFVCEKRGTVALKGKAEMETFYLLGRRTEWSAVQDARYR